MSLVDRNRLTIYYNLELCPKVLRILGVGTDMQRNLIVVVRMLTDKRVGVRHGPYPAILDIHITPWHKLVAHVGHGGKPATCNDGIAPYFVSRFCYERLLAWTLLHISVPALCMVFLR